MYAEPSAPELHATGTPVHAFSSQHTQRSAAAPSPTDKILVGAWDAGFCSCLDFAVPNCLMAWCCPWVAVAQIAARLGIYPFAKTLLLVLAVHVVSWVCLAVGYAQLAASGDRAFRPGMAGESSLLHLHLTAVNVSEAFSSWYFLSFFGSVAYAVGVWQLRTSVRERFQISGTWLTDAAVACCCSCCAVAQIATHVKSYTPGDCRFSAPVDMLPPYP